MTRTHDLNKAAAAGNGESVFTAGTGLVDKGTPSFNGLLSSE